MLQPIHREIESSNESSSESLIKASSVNLHTEKLAQYQDHLPIAKITKLQQEEQEQYEEVHIVFHLHDVATEENTEENTTDNTTEKKQKDYSNERKAVAEPKMIQICQQVLNKYIEIDLNIKQTTMKGHRAGLLFYQKILLYFYSEVQRKDGKEGGRKGWKGRGRKVKSVH